MEKSIFLTAIIAGILVLGFGIFAQNPSKAYAAETLSLVGEDGFDVFLKIDDIKGESVDNVHQDWNDVISYVHGMEFSGKKPVHDAFSIVKELDSASPVFYLAVNTNKRFSDATLEVIHSESRAKILDIDFIGVTITSVNYQGTSELDSRPLEDVSFTYEKIIWTYQKLNEDGTPVGPPITSGWDVKKNKQI